MNFLSKIGSRYSQENVLVVANIRKKFQSTNFELFFFSKKSYTPKLPLKIFLIYKSTTLIYVVKHKNIQYVIY